MGVERRVGSACPLCRTVLTNSAERTYGQRRDAYGRHLDIHVELANKPRRKSLLADKMVRTEVEVAT
ncbi:MAG: hypothetical protein L3K23_10410 [Thermoplasmata archaeon]|nr:hypothetical protein [Thermoplasmata archaeon]